MNDPGVMPVFAAEEAMADYKNKNKNKILNLIVNIVCSYYCDGHLIIRGFYSDVDFVLLFIILPPFWSMSASIRGTNVS